MFDNLKLEIESSVSCDFLGQANALLNDKEQVDYSYLPAAVLIGAVLEKTLRSLCERSFRRPAESGYEVDFAMKGGVVTKLVLRQQAYNNKREADPRSIKVVLPDGSCRMMAVQFR